MKKRTILSSLTVKIPLQLLSMLLIVMVLLSSTVVYMSRTATTKAINNQVNYLAQMNAAKVYSYLENMNAFHIHCQNRYGSTVDCSVLW